jgi:hypothetical protein
MVPISKAQGISSQNADVAPADVASKQFIDPSIRLRPGCPFSDHMLTVLATEQPAHRAFWYPASPGEDQASGR